MSVTLSYTNRDIELARQEGMRQIPLLTQGKWTDLNPTDPGVILLDYVHALVDMIQFYQDHQALEAYISQAKERKNILALAKQYSYKAKSATGSKCLVKVSVDPPHPYNITIPKGTRFQANLGNKTLYFLAMEDSTLYAGETSINVKVVEGEIKTLVYRGTGQKNQIIELPADLIDTDTITVVDDTQEVWKPIDFIFFSGQEKNYEIELQADNRIFLKLGDGVRGKSPTTDDTLVVTYLQTNGSEGNIGIGKITSIADEIRDSSGNVVRLNVYNEEPSSGGKNQQSDEEIKEQVPKVLKTMWRAVTLEDYETLAKEVNGVASAKALDVRTAPEMCLHHEVKVVVVPAGGSRPSQVLKDEVFKYLYPRTIPPVVLQIVDPAYKDIDLDITVGVDERYRKEEVEYNVKKALSDFFEQNATTFGGVIRYTEIITLISTAKGVKYIKDISLKNDIILNTIEIPRMGAVNVITEEA